MVLTKISAVYTGNSLPRVRQKVAQGPSLDGFVQKYTFCCMAIDSFVVPLLQKPRVRTFFLKHSFHEQSCKVLTPRQVCTSLSCEWALSVVS